MNYPHRVLVLATPAIAGFFALLAASCRAPAPEAKRVANAVYPIVDVRKETRPLTEAEAYAYAGDKRCVRCHPEAAAAVSNRHARTLAEVSETDHGAYFASDAEVHDPLLGWTYSVSVESGKCVMNGKSKSESGKLPADLVFGTGRNAFTYMSHISDDEWIDLRVSYYTKAGKWDFTPMQKPGDRTFTLRSGISQQGPMLVNCISCHATVIRESPRGIDIKNSQIGVRCERCHGPARAHAESAEARESVPSQKPVSMEKLGTSNRNRVMEVCGGCHRTAANAPAGDPKTENGLARFQGAALARSACFKKSATLSCITCHEPHTDVEMTPAKNNAKCLSCHDGSAVSKTVCLVNPRDGCVKCHMPAQKIKTIPYALYHNHWIKVWKEKVALGAKKSASVTKTTGPQL